MYNMKQIKNLPLYLSIFVIVIFSVFYFVSVNKYSYAFSYDEVKEASIHQERLIKKCAEIYADSNKNLFDGKETIYITIDDLVENIISIQTNNYPETNMPSRGEMPQTDKAGTDRENKQSSFPDKKGSALNKLKTGKIDKEAIK